MIARPKPKFTPATAGDVAPTRYVFNITATARRLLTSDQIRGALCIEMQSDPDNTLDILVDVFQSMDRPLQLAPADVRVLDLPAEVFPPGQARRRSFAFEFWAELATGSTAQTLIVWIWREA